VQRTEINGIELRIIVEAENAKYNVLNLLTEDEEEADEAYQRVVRIIDGYRDGTQEDVSNRDADEMVRQLKEFMTQRNRTGWPQAELLTVDEKSEGLFLPMSMQDFLVLESWNSYHFRSYRDEDDYRVPSLDQFLTVWSALGVAGDLGGGGGDRPAGNDANGAGDSTAQQGQSDVESEQGEQNADQGQEGAGQAESAESTGIGVNLNLAPAAVLAGLFDDRVVPGRFWSDLIEYRNLEEEEEEGEDEVDPIYDEFGDAVLDRRVFESLEELSEVRSWDDLDSETQSLVMGMLETQSTVFSIYITARRDMSVDGGATDFADAREKARAEEEPSGALVRTVRCVVWRKDGDDGPEVITIIPWEVVETVPHEVEDYPEEY
jgi:hypothetical protein